MRTFSTSGKHGRFCAIILHISYTHVCKPGLIYDTSYIPYFIHRVNMADYVLSSYIYLTHMCVNMAEFMLYLTAS